MNKQAIIRGFVKRAQEVDLSNMGADFNSQFEKRVLDLVRNAVAGNAAGAGLGGLAGAGVGAYTAHKDEEGNRENVGRRALLGALLGAPVGAVAGGGLGFTGSNIISNRNGLRNV